jgi:hypothetical protein
VYRYAAVVTQVHGPDGGAVDPTIDAASFGGTETEVTVVAGTFACFADGTFTNLVTTAGPWFKVHVYAFNKKTWDTNGNKVVGDANDPINAFALLRNDGATWVTECTATQQQNIEVLAVCAPLRTP